MVIITVRASAMCHLFIFLLLNFEVDHTNSLLEILGKATFHVLKIHHFG